MHMWEMGTKPELTRKYLSLVHTCESSNRTRAYPPA